MQNLWMVLPCLALCSRTKLDDGRDRFMYNYMVFAKKKYKDKWPDQVSQANYNYLARSLG